MSRSSFDDSLPLRKAWKVMAKGFDPFFMYGPSAGKIRGRVYMDITDAWERCSFADIRVLRHPELDQRSEKTEVEYVPQY